MTTQVAKKELSEQDQLFLDILFKEAKGDFYTARDLAGFSPKVPISALVKRMRTEILEGIQLYAAANAPAAIATLVDIVTSYDPVPDARNKISAAKELLGFAGIVKVEKKEVSHTGGVALLPPKNDR